MASQQANEGRMPVPSRGGVQHRARNSNGRWRKKHSGAGKGLRAPREINASPSEKVYWSMRNLSTTEFTMVRQDFRAKTVRFFEMPLAGSRQVFRDTSREQVQPMQQGEAPALAPFLVGAVDVDLDAPLEAEQKGLRSTKAHVECLRSIGLGSHALPSSGTQSVVSAKCLPGSVGADPGSSRQAD